MANSPYRTLAQKIYDVCHLSGEFTLRSGRKTAEYFDKYQFEANPVLLDEIAKALVRLIPAQTEVLAGLELGGIPLVTKLSDLSGLPAAFVRKIAKQYGTARLSEGADLKDKTVVLIEDVVTSGGQIMSSAQDLRSLGARTSYAICVIDRQEGAVESLADAGIQLKPLLKRADFVDL